MSPLQPRSPRRIATAFCTLGLSLAATVPVFGQATPQLTWGTGGAGGSGTWSTSTSNVDWYNGTANVPWTDGDTALFSGTAGTVSISGSVTTPQVTFTTPGYTIQDFFLTGAASGLTVETDADATISASIFDGGGSTSTPFTKTGSGVLTFPGQGPVFFASATIAAGEIRFTGTGSPNFTTPYVLANAAGVALTFASGSNDVASLSGGGANGGVVRPNVTSGSLSLGIYGSTSASFAGTIQDNGGASLALQQYGSGTQALTGANTYSGATTVASGVLSLAGANGSALNTASVSVFTGGTLLLDNSGASNGNRLAAGVPIKLGGGTLSLAGNAATATMQTVGALSFSRASAVAVAPAGVTAANLVFSSGMTRQSNGTISFTGGGNITVTGLTNTNGIVGGYATVNGTDWAAADANGHVFAYTNYVSTPGTATSADNVRLTSAGGDTTTLGKTASAFNSLNLVNSGNTAAVLDLGAGQTLALTSGGLLTSGGAGHVIQNGTLTAAGGELIVTNQAALTISSTVADAPAATTLTKSGTGTLLLTGTNTYTGPTVIDQGVVQAAADANLGAGSAVVINGGTLQAAAGFTSAKSLQGGGTLDTAGFNVAFNGGNNTGGFTKVGAGMLSLTGTVSSGFVAGGVLRLTNLAANNAASITLVGGRLEATGSGVQQVMGGGPTAEISPGSIGQAAALTIGSLSPFGSTIVIDFDLGSSTTDSLTLTSTFPINGGGFGQSLLYRFGNLGGTRTGVAYTLLNLPANSFGVSASEFGIDPASTAAGYKGTFNLTGSTLTITFTAVPEPGAAVWLLGALGIWAIRLRCVKALSSRRKNRTLA